MNPVDQIAEFLHRHAGFAPAGETVGQAVSRRLEALSLSAPGEYLSLLRRSCEELDELIEEIIVSETFFFRYPDSFRALQQWAAACPHRPRRILSLACSTGEEPYSIAMSLLDAGFSPSDFEIEARDLSAPSIARARAGFYTQKSFRDQAALWPQQYFSKTPKGWQIDPALARLVRFTTGNLLELSDSGGWHAIFCRNVLIYFSPQQQHEVIRRLRRALAEGGILFLGPAEPMTLLELNWTSAPYSMSFACYPPGAAQPPPASVSPRPLRAIRPPRSAPHAIPRPASAKPVSSTLPLPATPGELAHLHALADAGDLEKARAGLSALLQKEPENAAAYFLQGLIEETQGRLRQAEASYRKVLFLDPAHLDALQHMTLLLRSQGRTQAAANLARRAAQQPRHE